MEPNDVHRNVRLPKDLDDWLRAEAEKRERSVSALIRICLEKVRVSEEKKVRR